MSTVEAQSGDRDKIFPTLVTGKPERPRFPTENYLSVEDRFIRREELRRMIPVSDMTIWRWEKAGRFPRRVRLGKGPKSRVAWRLSSVLAWMCEREARDKRPAA